MPDNGNDPHNKDRYSDFYRGDDRDQFFIGRRDYNFVNQVNQELVERIVKVGVFVYKVDPNVDENVYGEAEDGGKSYLPPVKVFALLIPDDQQTEDQKFTFDVSRTVNFGFQRERLRDIGLYPERGDVIEWDDELYEIADVVDNELLGSKYYLRHSIVVRTHNTRETNTQINLPKRGTK